MTKRFEVGKTYSTRSICDYDTIFSFTILGRTAKTVTTKVSGLTVRRGLSLYEGTEQFKPFGTYSMCPIVSAATAPIVPDAVKSGSKEHLDALSAFFGI